MAPSPVSRSSSIYDSQIFEPFRDSLSELPFDEPVIDPHGCTFRKDFIIEWLSKNHTCPYTRKPLQAYQLIPNRALQHAQNQLFNEETGSVIRLQRQVSVLTLENKTLTEEKKELKIKNRQLKIEKQNLSADVKALMAVVQKQSEDIVKLSSENARILACSEKKDKDNEILTKLNQELRKDNEELRKDNEVLTKLNQELRKDNEESRKDNEVLTKLNQELRKDNLELREEHKILSKKIEDLSAKVEAKEDAKIVPIFEKIVKETNINNCKEKQIEPKKSSSGSDSCIAITVNTLAKPIVSIVKCIF